jgi:osomolarity two-component system, sensor histidine kinase SLN1
MTRTLERMGCQVSAAEDGLVALQMILGSEYHPDIIEAAESGLESPSRINSPRVHRPNGSTPDKKIVSFSSVQNTTPGSDTRPSLEGQERSSGPVKESKYALVFLDNQMPILSGVRTIKILRNLGREEFVVGLTGEDRFSTSSAVPVAKRCLSGRQCFETW